MAGENAIEDAPETDVEDTADTPPEDLLGAEADAAVEESADGADPQEDDQTGAEDDDTESEATEPEPKQSRTERRIAHLTAQLHAKDEEIAKLSAASQAVDAEAVKSVAVPMEYFAPHEVNAIKAANAAQAEEEFLTEHMVSGFEDPTDPSKNLTTQQIAKRLAVLRRDADRFAETRALYRQRQQEFVRHARLGRQVEQQRKAKPAAAVAKPKVAAGVKPSAPTSAPVSRPVLGAGPDDKRFEANAKKIGAKQARRMELAALPMR